MARRWRTGKRTTVARVERHKGSADPHGIPEYTDDDEWEQVLRWPCEVIGAKGGEVVRGRQVSDYSSHVLYGDFAAAKQIEQTDRIRVTVHGRELVLGILDIMDSEGDGYEMIIDTRRER